MNIISNISCNNTNFKQISKINKINKLTTYHDLKLIPNLNCACCGRKLIQPTTFHNAFKSITVPLKSIIKKGAFKPWERYTPTWNLLLDLSQKFPNKSLDQIERDNSTLHGKLFGAIRESIQNNQKKDEQISYNDLQEKIKELYRDILGRSRAQLRSSKIVMAKMKTFKKSLEKEPIKLAVFEQLEIYAQKYPKKTLSQILAMDEIYKFHSTKDLLQRAEAREKLDYHFNNIANIIRKESPESLELIDELKEQTLNLFVTEKDREARIPKAKKIYANALNTIGCEKLIKKVNMEIEQLPTTFISKDSFLAYAYKHNLSDYQILSSIFTPSVASSEHIVAVSKGGEDCLSNISVFCKSCNDKRGSESYIEFLEYHPEMPRNEQKQINQIGNYILKNDVCEEALYYPIDVAQTLRTTTNNKINPNVSRYCEKKNQQISQEIYTKKEEIVALKKERREMQEEKEALLKRLNEIDETRSSKKTQIKELSNEISKNIRIFKEIQKSLDNTNPTLP